MGFVSEKIKFKKYTSYKYSGSEWIGEIPKDWKVVCNRALFTERNEAGNESLPILSVSIHTAVSNEELSEEDNIQGRNRIADKSNYKLVQPNDIVFNMMRAWQGAIGSVSITGMVSPAYIVARPNNKIHSGFFEYQYRTVGFIQQIDKHSKGITDFRKRLYWQEFKNLITILPSIDEQAGIASFLDRKTAQIDKAISIKERQIELLKERRQILIHHAVTRGLNPNVKLKYSGVEWIGEIPEHWEIQPIKYSLDGIVDCEHSTAPFVDEEDFFVVRTSNVKNGKLTSNDAKFTNEQGYKLWTRRGVPKAGDVMLTREAPAGEACLVPKDKKICLGQRMVWLKINRSKLNPQFAIDLIYSKLVRTYIDYLSAGSTVLHFNMADIKNIPIISMPINEQNEIVFYTEKISSKISRAITCKVKEIEKLKEYKATLINSAVTGKIKVS